MSADLAEMRATTRLIALNHVHEMILALRSKGNPVFMGLADEFAALEGLLIEAHAEIAVLRRTKP